MASPINKEGRRLEFRKGTPPETTRWRIMKALHNKRKKTETDKETVTLLLYTLILPYTLTLNAQLERKQLNLSYHALTFTFRLLSTRRSMKPRNTEMVPELLTALTAFSATFFSSIHKQFADLSICVQVTCTVRL